MKKHKPKNFYVLYLFFTVLLLSQFFYSSKTFAATDPIDETGSRTNLNFTYTPTSEEGIVPCGHGTPCTLCHLIVGIQRLVKFGLGIAIVLAILGIVISGILYIISSGNTSMIETAKRALTGSLTGFAIFFGAWIIINTVIMVASIKSDLGIQQAGGWTKFTCSTASSAGSGGGGTPETPSNPGDPTKLAECNKWCNDNKAVGDTEEAKKYNSECLNGCSSQFGSGGNPAPSGDKLSQSDAQKQLDSCGVKYANANTLNGLQSSTIQEMCNLKSESGCIPQISTNGGTTGNHAITGSCNHSSGCKADFIPNSCNDTWIKNHYPRTGTRSDGAACYSAPSGACYAREGDHWDMSSTRSCQAQGC